MLTVSSFVVPPESFAPYNYVCKHISNLHERYAELAKTLGFDDNLETSNFDHLNIHICEQNRCKETLDITDVISRKGNKCRNDKGHNNYKSLRTFLEGNATAKSKYVSLVVINEGYDFLEEITALKDKYSNVLFIITADEHREEQAESKCKAEKRTDNNILVSSRQNINDDIGDELERIVLRTIRAKCENVNKWLIKKKSLFVTKADTVQSRKRKAFDEACSKIKVLCRPGLSINDKENDKHFHNSHAAGNINSHVSMDIKDKLLQMNDKSKGYPHEGVQEYSNEKRPVIASTSRSISNRLQRVDRDTIESLLAEMVALYNNSRVPNYERPDISQYGETEISEKLKTELFHISSVRGVGYRFTCFVVFVERGDEAENQQQKIRSVLKENKIDDYEIQNFPEQRNYCGVGSKIRASQICRGRNKPVEGTLGCFAHGTRGRDTNMYALVSMHVARFCDSFYISSSTSEVLGQVIVRSVVDTGLDIAALRLDQHIKICAKFKTEDDGSVSGGAVGGGGFDLLQGKLNHYSDHLDRSQSDIVCNGQKVYIWGAVSNPGKGVITMRAYQHDGMKALIQIEDREPSKVGEIPKRFCRAGDSGAIVCAEDSRGRFVHILAMVIGIINEKEVENNPKIKGKYLSVPLSSGLEELKERTGFTFQICECIDS